jgi:hypothetical protein
MSPAMDGQLVCYVHGGNQKSGKAKAQKLIAQHEMLTRASKILAYDDLKASTPEEGLLMEVKWSGQVAIAYGEACEALIADEALTTKSASAGMQLHALMNAWTKERINHDDCASWRSMLAFSSASSTSSRVKRIR